ncbi:hypothetical protein ACLKA7_000482 [Drosophila subpalustris]
MRIRQGPSWRPPDGSQSVARGISSRFSQPQDEEVSSRFQHSEHREIPSRFQQSEERGNSSRFHQSQEQEILSRFHQSEERRVPSRSHRPEAERRIPSRNREEERSVSSRFNQRADRGIPFVFNQPQERGTPSRFHQSEERELTSRSHRPEEARIPARLHHPHEEAILPEFQQPGERGISSSWSNQPQKARTPSSFQQSEARQIPSRFHTPQEEEIHPRFRQSEERVNQPPDGGISSWFNQPQVAGEIPPRFHQSDDIPERRSTIQQQEQFHRSPQGRRGSEYNPSYNPSPERGHGFRGSHGSPGPSRSSRRWTPVGSRESPPPRDTISSSSSCCTTRKKSLQREEEFQSKRSKDTYLPTLGEPGGLDDPRRQNLCDSRTKLYLRYLREGFEPDEAISMARNKPSSWEKWYNQQEPEDNVPLTVFLLPRGYPDIKLNHEDKLDLEEAITMEVASAQLPTPLRFTSVAFRKGFLEVQCFNRFAADWLMCKGSKLSSYQGPRVEARFHLPTQDEHIIKVFLPCSQNKTSDFLIQLLKSQNDYDFKLWHLVKRNNRGHGSVVVFGIDRKSALDIVHNGHQLFYRMGTVAVRGLKQLEKDLKQSQVDNVDDNLTIDGDEDEDEDIDGVPIEAEDDNAL